MTYNNIHPKIKRVLKETANLFATSVEDIMSGSREAVPADARAVASAYLYKHLLSTHSRVSALFSQNRSTTSFAIYRAYRDPYLKFRLETLEKILPEEKLLKL